jgi:hypothetical protein
MSDPLMIDGHALESEADDIIARLTEECHVALIDLDQKQSHTRMSSWWFSHGVATEDLETSVLNRTHADKFFCVPINRRWILRVAGRGTRKADDDGWIVTYSKALPLSIEHQALVTKTAQLLARFLPPTSRSSYVPPPNGTGSGGSGSAELDIPVW